jgi:hypothetical protein
MTSLTQADVIAVLGPVEDRVVSEIIATGATVADLTHARAWIANDEALINLGKPLAASRVGELIEILSRLEEDDEDRERKA